MEASYVRNEKYLHREAAQSPSERLVAPARLSRQRHKHLIDATLAY